MTEWPAWRLVVDEVATLGELSGPCATYSLSDCYKANAILDMRADVEREQQQRQRRAGT